MSRASKPKNKRIPPIKAYNINIPKLLDSLKDEGLKVTLISLKVLTFGDFIEDHAIFFYLIKRKRRGFHKEADPEDNIA